MLKRFFKDKSGASLIEILVAIVILGMVIVPLGSSFVLSVRLNARSRALMQEQLAVSNAVEMLMASGIDKAYLNGDYYEDSSVDAFSKVEIEVGEPQYSAEPHEEDADPICYPVTVTYAGTTDGSKPFSLETTVRWVPTPQPDPEEEGDGT
jgi:type II secretory pathway pseudopilin PulG